MKACIIFIILSLTLISANDRGGLELSGEFKTDIAGRHFYIPDERDSVLLGGVNTLSIRTVNKNRAQAKFSALLDLKVPFGSFGTTSMKSTEDSSASVFNDYLIMSPNGNIILVDLRRFYTSLYFERFTFSVGRKKINFGQGVLFSPIDVFSDVDYATLNFEKRVTDVVQLEIPIAVTSGVDLTFELPYGEREHSSAIKGYCTLGNFDISLIALYRHLSEKFVSGISFRGDAIVGIYGENVVTSPIENSDVTYDGMIGVDYSINRSWYVLAEYQYIQLKDNHSVFSSATFTVNELVALNASLLHSLSLRSSIGTFQCSWNALQNCDITFAVRGYNNVVESIIPVRNDLDYSVNLSISF